MKVCTVSHLHPPLYHDGGQIINIVLNYNNYITEARPNESSSRKLQFSVYVTL